MKQIKIGTATLIHGDCEEFMRDLPPEGYLAWHEWAELQWNAGIKQVQCGSCGLWKTPQELSGVKKEFVGRNFKHGVVSVTYDICIKCNNI